MYIAIEKLKYMYIYGGFVSGFNTLTTCVQLLDRVTFLTL